MNAADAARRQGPLGGLALAALAAVAFFPALEAGFVWDDSIFTEEPAVQRASGLRDIWFSPGAVRGEAHYWPLTYTTFWLEHRLWGLAPFGYHLVNLLLYAGNVLLLWRLCLRLSLPGAWAATAIWAVHPLHVESVAWVIERKDVLSGLCFLGAALAYVRFRETKKPGPYGLSLALYALGLLAKSAIVPLPAAMLVWHWLERGRLRARDFLRTAPFFAAGLLISLGDMAFYRGREAAAVLDYSLLERTLIAARALWFYAGKLAWPTDLAVIYPRWDIRAGDPLAWAWLAAAALLAAGLWFGRRRFGRGPLAGVLFFALMVSPALGFVDFGYMKFSFVADRFQYLAGFGPIAVVVAAAAAGARRLPRAYGFAAPAVLATTLALLGTATWRQAGLWRDGVTLFSHVVALNPEARGAHFNLAKALREEGRHEESLAASRISVERFPDEAEAFTGLGLVLLELNRFDEAEASFARALELDPRHLNTHQNLADALRRQGRHEEAAARFRAVLDLDEGFPLAWAGLGSSLFDAGRHEEAIGALRRALDLAPSSPNAAGLHLLLGRARLETGRIEAAERSLLEAARLAPGAAMPFRELAKVYSQLERPADAEEVLARAAELEPPDPTERHARAEALRAQGRLDAALAVYREALETAPEFAPSLAGLGAAMFQLGRHEEAVETLDRALALDPELPAAAALHRLTGLALMELGRPGEAAARFERCLELDPLDAEALDRLAFLRFDQERFDDAVDLYRRMLATDPDEAQTHFNLGIALLLLGRHEEAAASLERSLALDPEQPTARDALADARRRAGAGQR